MKTLVIEDSRVAREGLIRMLSEFSSLNIVGAGGNAETARQLVSEHHPSLLFLDIHMPGENGFELLDSLDYQPKVIFTTAYAQHAIQSFDYPTVDYLLKPISRERLKRAVDKLYGDKAPTEDNERPLFPDSRLFIKDGETCHLVAVHDIEYAVSCKNYTQLFFNDQKAYVKKALNQVERRLPTDSFFRASRQHIVNFNHIETIQDAVDGGYDLQMKSGSKIHVSRRNAHRLRQALSL